jgi:quercetin dioxygenase-like cupin family protein
MSFKIIQGRRYCIYNTTRRHPQEENSHACDFQPAASAQRHPGHCPRHPCRPSGGLSKLSVWQQSVAPGCATPPHRHDCEEVVICSGGTGELRSGEKVQQFACDMTVVIPANVEHQIINTGRAPLQIVAVFSMSPVRACFSDGTEIELPWRS